MIINYLIASINFAALVLLIIERGLPQPFPWKASAWLALVLLAGGLVSPHAGIERGVSFVTLLSAFVVTTWLKRFGYVYKYVALLAIPLAAFLLVDALRIIPTPDITVTSGETFEMIRRPYLISHPNLKAAWLLLLTLSPVTLIGVVLAQSRGALLGYITALSAYSVPRRYYVQAIIVCIGVMSIAAAVRPGTMLWRVDAWREAVDIFVQSPWIGIGSGTYITHAASGASMAHNAALTIAAENGLLGLSALIVWLVPVAVIVMRSKHIAKYNLLAFAVQQAVDDQWLHPVSAILIGVMLAVCIKQKGNEK